MKNIRPEDVGEEADVFIDIFTSVAQHMPDNVTFYRVLIYMFVVWMNEIGDQELLSKMCDDGIEVAIEMLDGLAEEEESTGNETRIVLEIDDDDDERVW